MPCQSNSVVRNKKPTKSSRTRQPRRTAFFETLEPRNLLAQFTQEFPVQAIGTIEARSSNAGSVYLATTGNVVHYFPNKQAGQQGHPGTGNFFAWQTTIEVPIELPSYAQLISAKLQLPITEVVDGMGRGFSLVAHTSAQEVEGEITVGEYNNAAGNAMGSIPHGSLVANSIATMVLDTHAIPISGTVSIVLQTSDQLAQQAPVMAPHGRSAVYFTEPTLVLTYEAPDSAAVAPTGPPSAAVEPASATSTATQVVASAESLPADLANELRDLLSGELSQEIEDAKFRAEYRAQNEIYAAVTLPVIEADRRKVEAAFQIADANLQAAKTTTHTTFAKWEVAVQTLRNLEPERMRLQAAYDAVKNRGKVWYQRPKLNLEDFMRTKYNPAFGQEQTWWSNFQQDERNQQVVQKQYDHMFVQLTYLRTQHQAAVAFASSSHSAAQLLPTIPLAGEPASPSAVWEAAGNRIYAGQAHLSAWIEFRGDAFYVTGHVASPRDASRLWIPFFGFEQSIVHVGGSADATFNIRLDPSVVGEKWDARRFEVQLLDPDTGAIVEKTAFAFDRYAAPNMFQMLVAPDRFWERTPDEPTPAIPPRLVPLLASGNRLVVSVDAPGSSSYLSVLGVDNSLVQSPLQHAGGAIGLEQVLTFTQAIRSGTYEVTLSSQVNGVALARFPVQWNAELKQVSFGAEAFTFLASFSTATEELSPVVREELRMLGESVQAVAAQRVTRLTDLSYSVAAVADQTWKGLDYPLLQNIWATADAKMMAAMPNLFPPDEGVWIAAQVAGSNGSLTFTIVADRLHRNQADMFDRLRDGLGDMERAGIKMVASSMQHVANVYTGTAESAEWGAFQRDYAAIIAAPYYQAEVAFLASCGIAIPTPQEFWRASWFAFHTQQEFLMHMKQENAAWLQIRENQAIQRERDRAANYAHEQLQNAVLTGTPVKTPEQYEREYLRMVRDSNRGNDDRAGEVTRRLIDKLSSGSYAVMGQLIPAEKLTEWERAVGEVLADYVDHDFIFGDALEHALGNFDAPKIPYRFGEAIDEAMEGFALRLFEENNAGASPELNDTRLQVALSTLNYTPAKYCVEANTGYGNLLGNMDGGVGVCVDGTVSNGEYLDPQYLLDSLEQVLLGQATTKVTGLGTAGELVISFTPIGIAADVRDLAVVLSQFEFSVAYGTGLGLTVAGFIPAVGELRKIGKHGDELLFQGRQIINSTRSEVDFVLKAKPKYPGIDFLVTPRGVVVPTQLFVRQGISPQVGNFTGLTGKSVEEIFERVPASWTMQSQKDGRGIRFLDEFDIERIRIHGPGTTALAGSNSANGWILRVMSPTGEYFDDLGNVVSFNANEGHIPLYGNANLLP